MTNISLSRKPAYWLDCQEFPDEYERMWAELAALEGDRFCKCPKSGEVWQYMGTQLEFDGWKHCFRHRHHPGTQQCEYRMISCQEKPVIEMSPPEHNHQP
jgi:hypothetical protein